MTKTMKKLFVLVLAMAMLLCGGLSGVLAEGGDLGYIATGSDIPENPMVPAEKPEPKSQLTVRGAKEVRGGDPVQLTAYLNGVAISSSEVEWAVYPYNPKLATISQGKLSTKKVDYVQSVHVTAALKEDHTIYGSFVVTIRPSMKSLTIKASSTYVDLSGSGTLKLRVDMKPELCVEGIKWTSSAPSVASVSSNGLVTGHKTGKVVITAEALDGSGLSDSITLRVVNGVSGLVIQGPDYMVENSSILLAAVTMPGNASVKDVIWAVTVPEDAEIKEVPAAINAEGRLTAKAVEALTEVKVTAVSESNPDVTAEHTVFIAPAVEKITVTAPEDNAILDLNGEGTLQLTATVEPADANQEVTWSTSDERIATVDENGLVHGKRPGKVTITATATDGTKKTGKIQLTLINAVKELVISGPNMVSGGQSIKLEVSVGPDNVSSDTVTWSVDSHSTIATISKDGRLTVKKDITEPYLITVTATSKLNPEISDSYDVLALPAVTKVEIAAPAKLIDISAAAKTMQLTANCTPAEAYQAVTWTSSNPAVATVDESGLVTALKAGKVTITAKAKDGSGVSATVVIDVVRAVQGVVIEGEHTVASGHDITLKAYVMPEDASNQAVTWSVNCDDTIAVINANGRLTAEKGIKAPLKIVVIATSKENPDMSAAHAVTVVPAVTKMSIEAAQDYIDFSAEDKTLQLTAVCEPAVASQAVTWTSGSENVATVDENGLVTAKKVGSAVITAKAKDGSGVSARFTVKVVRAVKGVVIEGPTSVASGKRVTLKAHVLPEDASNQKVTWQINTTDDIATISASGEVKAASGITEPVVLTVTATSAENEHMVGTYILTIRPAVEKITVVAAQNFIDFSQADKTLQLIALCDPDKAAQEVTWSSSKPSVASIDENGLVTAKAIGSTSITATAKDGSGKMTRITIDVVRAVTGVVIEGETEVASGKSVTLKAYVMPENASNQNVVWSVDCDKSVATISGGVLKAASGLAERVTVTVTATSKENKNLSATHEVTICPLTTKVSIDAPQNFIDIGLENKTLQLIAIAVPEDASQQIAWASSKPSVATVDENGLVTAKKIGSTSITATAKDGSGKMARITIHVVCAVKGLTLEGPAAVASGERITYKASILPENATNRKVLWTLDCDKSIATISEDGVLSIKADVPATTVITVTATSEENEAITASQKVTITPAVASVAITAPRTFIDVNAEDKTLQLTAKCTPADASQEVTWSSSNAAVATVDEKGLVTAVKAGSATIKATAKDGTEISASVTINVVTAVKSVEITGSENLMGGSNVKLTAAVLPAEADNKAVTWSVDCDETVATISTSGRLYAKKVTEAVAVTVRATSKENTAIYDEHVVTIRPGVTGVVISAPQEWISISANPTLQLTASVEPATAHNDVTWSSDNTSVATVDENGLVTAKKVGTANITARATDGSGRYKRIAIQVIDPVTSIVITADASTVEDGQVLRLRAAVTPDDATNARLTWTSSNPEVATVVNGVVAGLAVTEPQTVTITATTASGPVVSATFEVTVLPRSAE